jgi:FAD:protein FMN transferase
MNHKKTLKTILFLATVLLITGCTPKQLYTADNFKLYTVVQITTYGQLKDKVYDEIWSFLDHVDDTMSMTLASSEIVAINAAAGSHPVIVSDDTYKVIEAAIEFSKISNKFDISIGSLVSLWGIGSDFARVPTENEILEILPLINFEKIVLDPINKSVFLEDEGMQIDLGAIAKGYAADETKNILLKNGVKSAIINYGGNILTVGTKEQNANWNVGIQHPDQSRGSYIGVLPLKDKSVVTSGTYERFLEVDGKAYHHILDPNTGYPVENGLWSITIISDSSMDGDALSTLVFAEGLEKGLEIVENLENVDAIFVTEDFNVIVSSGIKETFRLTDSNFTLID